MDNAVSSEMARELEFLGIAEKLKGELRHSYLSDGRRESVAEHSWRLALMAMRYAARLREPVDLQRCMQLAIVHDLPEAKVGDIPVFECSEDNAKQAKAAREDRAMQEITELLGDAQGDQMYALWREYEDQHTPESHFIKALDKLEAWVQHNEAALDTWEEREKRMVFQDRWLLDHCSYDPFLRELAIAVIRVATEKLRRAGEDLEDIARSAQLEARP